MKKKLQFFLILITTATLVNLDILPMIFNSLLRSLNGSKNLLASSVFGTLKNLKIPSVFNNISPSLSTFPVNYNIMVKLLSQEEAIAIDVELFNEYKFSVDQLMELAGLSVAASIARAYDDVRKHGKKVLIVCGPGNNGGDGMVAARHLKIFGFPNVALLMGRKPNKDLFINLTHQAAQNDVTISYNPDEFLNDLTSIGLVVDGLFGFSFKPPVREEFQPLMKIFTSVKVPIVAIDIPSGWDVENGPPADKSIYFMPDTLVSLTAPKKCSTFFKGPNHFIGGRFVPEKLAKKYALQLPQYPGIDCIVRL